jgi:hypothetical protein
VYWAGAGLEGPLLALALAVGGAATLHEIRRGGAGLSGFALGVAALTRPEGPLYVAALAAGVLEIRRGRIERSDLVRVAIAASMTLGYEAFRVAYFADVLPNTYYAKVGHDLGHFAYVGGFLDAHAPALVVSASAICALLALRLRGAAVAALTLAFVSSGVFFALYAGGDWMTEHRFLAPVVPFLGAPVAAVLSGLRDESARTAPMGSGFRLAVPVSVAAIAAVGFHELPRHAVMLASATFPCHFVRANARQVRIATDRLGLRRPRIAITDIGGHSLVLAHAEIVDAAGLADRVIAHAGEDTEAIADYILFDPPSVLDAHGPGAGVLHARGGRGALHAGGSKSPRHCARPGVPDAGRTRRGARSALPRSASRCFPLCLARGRSRGRRGPTRDGSVWLRVRAE